MMKRSICALIALIILFGTVACSPAPGEAVTDEITTKPSEPETTEEPDETEEPFIIKEDTLVFAQNNVSEYTIIRPENSTDANVKAASELRSYIKKISEIEIPIKTDAEPAGEYEGQALGINGQGELLVKIHDGSIKEVYAGEVSVRGIYGYV